MNCDGCEEGAYVIDKLAKLLAEIAIIVNGPEPPLTRWSYHDLPEKVRALRQAPPAAVVPDREAVAIAICEAFTTPKGVLWWATTDEQREVFRGQADAAIAAMLAAAQGGVTGDKG